MLTLAITVCFLGTLFFLGYVTTQRMRYSTAQYAVSKVTGVCRCFFKRLMPTPTLDDGANTSPASDVPAADRYELTKIIAVAVGLLGFSEADSRFMGVYYSVLKRLSKLAGLEWTSDNKHGGAYRISIPDSKSAENVLKFSQDMSYETCRSFLQTADLFESHAGYEANFPSLCDMTPEEVDSEILYLAGYPHQMGHVVNNQSLFPRFLRLQVIRCMGYEGYQGLITEIDNNVTQPEEWTELDTSDVEEETEIDQDSEIERYPGTMRKSFPYHSSEY